MTVTKACLIDSINSQYKLPKNRSAKLIDSIIEILKNSLESGDEILISGFGKFVIKRVKYGRNRPSTKDDNMALPAEKVLRFKCSPVLMNKVNEKGDKLF